jgi:hypothetical protein
MECRGAARGGGEEASGMGGGAGDDSELTGPLRLASPRLAWNTIREEEEESDWDVGPAS